VAECNHHIRNALQVLIFNYDGGIQRQSLGISRQLATRAPHRADLEVRQKKKAS